MIIIENKLIPFKGFKAINLFGIIFKRKDASPLRPIDISHELIHTSQMKELGYIGFYIIYIIEWLYYLITYWDSHLAYRSISFEREAFTFQNMTEYLKARPHYAQWFM